MYFWDLEDVVVSPLHEVAEEEPEDDKKKKGGKKGKEDEEAALEAARKAEEAARNATKPRVVVPETTDAETGETAPSKVPRAQRPSQHVSGVWGAWNFFAALRGPPQLAPSRA